MSRRQKRAGQAEKLDLHTDSVRPGLENKEGGNIEEAIKGALPYIISSIPLIMALYSVLRIGASDSTTVFLLLRTLNIPAVLVSTLSPIMPVVVAVVYALLFRRYLDSFGPASRIKLSTRDRNSIFFISWSAPAIAIILLPVVYAPLLITFRFVEVWAWQALQHGKSVLATILRKSSLVILFGFCLAPLSVTPKMWLPLEVIKTKSNTKGEVVFVLEAGDHDLTIMRAENYKPEILRQEDVLGRSLCIDSRTSEKWTERM